MMNPETGRTMSLRHLTKLVATVWNYLREVSGENDYARYCVGVRKLGGQPVSARAFYIEQLECKNSRPTRCC
jgi:Selenoprotein, putative